jgi:hypothetical protein
MKKFLTEDKRQIKQIVKFYQAKKISENTYKFDCKSLLIRVFYFTHIYQILYPTRYLIYPKVDKH